MPVLESAPPQHRSANLPGGGAGGVTCVVGHVAPCEDWGGRVLYVVCGGHARVDDPRVAHHFDERRVLCADDHTADQLDARLQETCRACGRQLYHRWTSVSQWYKADRRCRHIVASECNGHEPH